MPCVLKKRFIDHRRRCFLECLCLNHHMNWFKSFFNLFFFSVVVFVTDLHIAREGMLHAYDEKMINGDYVFIIFELDQAQVGIYSNRPFKWFFSSYKDTLNRYHHVKDAFQAAFVLAIKSPSSKSYMNFTEELKIRSRDEPFNSLVYTGYLWTDNKKFPANKTKVRYWFYKLWPGPSLVRMCLMHFLTVCTTETGRQRYHDSWFFCQTLTT